jgi:SAM-dependent methyltransferase
VDVELARWLVSAEAAPALEEASNQADPASLAAAAALRRHWPADRAAAVLGQQALRRRAVAKFGDRAGSLFLTPDGLEQATRADVARWRSQRFVAAGAREVVDLGCGIGADALAFLDAGLDVVAVEADPATAVLAQANLGERAQVVTGDAVDLADGLLAGGAAAFIDPARRTAAGRTWRVADFSPPWEFATGLLEGRVGAVKAAPGLPSVFIPGGVAGTWVSHRGDLVEASLWSGPWRPGSRTAVLLPAGAELEAGARDVPAVGPPGRYLYEPDPAVIRSGVVGALAGLLGARVAQDGIAYLFADELVESPFATAFEVREELPFDERALRRWVRDRGVGILELKVRGMDVDPAALRRRLKPKGPASATMVLTPTVNGARALVSHRLG